MWASECLGPDGKIYCAPYNATDVLIIDTLSGTAHRTDFGLNLSDSFKWAGAVLTNNHRYAEGILASDGKIYAIPYTNTPAILVIDPVANMATLSTMGINLSKSGLSEAILGPDNKTYAVP